MRFYNWTHIRVNKALFSQMNLWVSVNEPAVDTDTEGFSSNLVRGSDKGERKTLAGGEEGKKWPGFIIEVDSASVIVSPSLPQKRKQKQKQFTVSDTSVFTNAQDIAKLIEETEQVVASQSLPPFLSTVSRCTFFHRRGKHMQWKR